MNGVSASDGARTPRHIGGHNSGSCVAAPLELPPVPVGGSWLKPPAPVPKLTAGHPSPESIDQQKEVYAKSIEDQLRRGHAYLDEQNHKQTELLHATAAKIKEQHIMAIDKQVKQQEVLLAKRYNETLLMLQQAAQQQRSELETQAHQLHLEYQRKKAQEDFLQQSYDLQMQNYEAQAKLHAEMQQLGLASGMSAAARPSAVPAAVQEEARPIPVPVAAQEKARPIPLPVGAQEQARPLPMFGAVQQQARPVPVPVAAQGQARPVPMPAAVQKQARPVQMGATVPEQARPVQVPVAAQEQVSPRALMYPMSVKRSEFPLAAVNPSAPASAVPVVIRSATPQQRVLSPRNWQGSA